MRLDHGGAEIRTMEIIRDLETGPRHAYTGAIGYVKPGGDCVFNVAIRTVVANEETGEAVAHVGGGITYDSTPSAEFDECLTKAKYLMTPEIEFDLLETLLVEDGKTYLLEEHIRRMRSSASYFDFRFDEEKVREILSRTVSDLSAGTWRLRLLLNRKENLTIQVGSIEPLRQSEYRVRLAPMPIDQTNIFLYHKTTNRNFYERALLHKGDADDVLLWNEDGEMTESTIANLVINEGGVLYTPPQSSGLLRGTFRDHLLAKAVIAERVITREQLFASASIYLINSVRKWIPAKLIR